MNLARVLDVSLPELPKSQGKERYFRFNPNITVRERQEKGVTSFYVVTPQRKVFLLTPERWKLVQLFNGSRNYEQVARLWKQHCGVSASADSIRGFAETLDDAGFWMKTPEEEAMAMMEALKERQDRVKKTRSLRDFTKLYLFTVDIDHIITRAQRYVWFIWTTAFVLCSLAALMLMVGLWIARRDEVWRDSVLYWSMANKSGLDVLEFYLIFAVVGFFHEAGHALTAKNFGAGVHRVGMMLVYTVPAFFVDTTEAVLHANYFQRMYVVLAGFWFELMLCAMATFIWWNTAIGGTAHNLAYKFILVGGIMPVLFNMNPLMRLDGYIFFSKLIRQPFLKEKSTAFLSAWVRGRVFKLPATVEPLRRRRAIFYAAYALLSGCYTYFVLTYIARVTYRVVYNSISPDWAFLPATLVALAIFRSRIEKFVDFLKQLYAKYKERMMVHRKKVIFAAAVVVLVLFLPLWRETVRAPAILEPIHRAVLTARVPAQVEDVLVNEGETVHSDTPVAMLRSLDVDSEKEMAHKQWEVASANATEAQLHYADYAAAEAERRQWSERVRVGADKQRRLTLTAPIAGMVSSPHIQDLRGAFLKEGTPVAEIHDISQMRARIFVDEADVRTLTKITGNAILLNARFASLEGRFEQIGPQPEDPDPGLIDVSKYKGLKPPSHYSVTVLLANDGTLRSGMSGEAKLFGIRRSIMSRLWRPIADFVGRKVW